MNCNTKLEVITEDTLIIGIDVAKYSHLARMFDHRGAELCKRIIFENSRNGFTSFIKAIEELKSLHMKKDIVIGLEPTGVYGHVLIAYFKDRGYNVVYVLGIQVKRTKELEDNSPSKNDFKDAKIIASLVRSGYYFKIRNHAEEITELKDATSFAYQLTKKIVRVKCQIQDCLTEYFPEFPTVFKCFNSHNSNRPNQWGNKTAMITLHQFPLPDQINELTAEQIVSAWRTSGVIKGIGIKKAVELKQLAKDTIGLKPNASVHMHFKCLMDELDLLTSQENEIWHRIKALVEKNPDFNTIMRIPHMTMKMAAYLLAEVGDFRDFDHPQQIVRLAGFNLKESSSGGSRGQSQITKRGRSLLRRVLYFIVLEQLKHAAPGWHQLHKYYTTRKNRPLKKMQSVIALCCKLLRVVWSMIKNDTPYDPDLLLPKKELLKTA